MVLYGKPYRGFESPPLRHLVPIVSPRTFLVSIILVSLGAALLVAAQDSTMTPSADTSSAQSADSGSAVIVPGSPETMALQKLLRGSSTSIGVYETVESRRLWKILRDTYAERRYR